MMALEKVDIDIVALMKVAEACACLGALKQLKSVHGYFIKRWIDIDTDTDRWKVDDFLILMYSKCGDFLVAEKLFNGATEKNVISWTCMISCCNQRSCYREALEIFIQMQAYGIKLNAITMMNVLHSCTRLGYLGEGQSIHCFMIKRCVDMALSIWTVSPRHWLICMAASMSSNFVEMFSKLQKRKQF